MSVPDVAWPLFIAQYITTTWPHILTVGNAPCVCNTISVALCNNGGGEAALLSPGPRPRPRPAHQIVYGWSFQHQSK